ncbi:MAG: fibronectin type III domain-containing protein [Jatrophihabitans sp.]|uniref:fibronectin type III domain-containing protein n=1 Tax=Jatrophihabitans sp. TaxID=1932789 RepID=UPI00391008DE
MIRRSPRVSYSRSGAIVLRRPPRRRRGVAALAAALSVIGISVVGGAQLLGGADAATLPGSPVGVGEHMYGRPGGVRFVGWAVDPDTPLPISVDITVDGVRIGSSIADRARPDVALKYPSAGPDHGFDTVMPVSEGKHTLCVIADNVGAGANTTLRCSTYTLDYGPVGKAEHLTAAHGHMNVSGWAFDRDDPTAPVTISVAVDQTITRFPASGYRPDIATQYPGVGPNHGFAKTLAISQGKHNVCIRATSIGFGADNTLWCSTFTLNDSPRVGINQIGQHAGALRVYGWSWDPDAPTSPLTMTITVDGIAHSVLANLNRTDVATAYPSAGPAHGFDQSYQLTEATHTVCVTAHNVFYGSNTALACRSVVLNFRPTASLAVPTATATGAKVTGWASDPDTSAAIPVRLTVDGVTATTVTANGAGTTHTGHNFSAALTMKSGTHTICAIGINVLYGTRNSVASCQSITLALRPIGAFESLTRDTATTNLQVTGWSIDPDTTAPVSVAVTRDGVAYATVAASAARSDIPTKYPAYGTNHGLSAVVTADAGEHTICLTAKNVGGGSDVSLGCKVVNAVNPVAPSAPRSVAASVGIGTATVTWVAPASDGGAPWTKFTVVASPGGKTVVVGAAARSASFTGLANSTAYRFSVTATNVAGTSLAGVSPTVTTPSGIPAQTTAAPVSTSRYIRNIRTATATELSVMRAEGQADALANPSGHRYLILLDIGGQDQADGGVVLSATTRFVTYADLVMCLKSYVDGYHSGQRSSAPVTIAIGTNNDMDVSSTSGKAWATQAVNPVVTYAAQYANMTIAGANDIEPGFRSTYSATSSWLSGYLANTGARFVFNGSADGCSWTAVNRTCNNGWTMAGLYNLAAGAAPTRTQNLPQVYNYTMADQWKYISLTGIAFAKPRINFLGPLTEWTACSQAGSCGSITGVSAWNKLWADLQSDARLQVSSLPHATDLRIDS